MTFVFHSVGNFMIPTDEVHHISEGLKLPSSNGICWNLSGLDGIKLRFFLDFEG